MKAITMESMTVIITPCEYELIVRNTNITDPLYCVGSRSEMEFWVVCSIATALASEL